MAASYWSSTQRRHWQFTKNQLTAVRQELVDEDPALVQMFPLPQVRHLNIYFQTSLNKLAKRLNIRQQPIATAQVYLKRFYTRVEMRRTNPYLVMATALYLACKMEEAPLHIRVVANEARTLWSADHQQLLDSGRVGECEFFLISEMDSQLIVHQPYRTLTGLQAEFSLSQDELTVAWQVINDSYATDLPLVYPPHVIALTAILLSLVLRPGVGGGAIGAANLATAAVTLQQAQGRAGGGGTAPVEGGDKKTPDPRMAKVQRFASWLAESNVDIEAMVDTTQELISYYECHEQYNEKLTREQVNRYVKARGLDK